MVLFIRNRIISVILMFCINMYTNAINDQTSTRANTLLDDADDIQNQLDNEARDRLSRPKTVWMLHFPPQFPDSNSIPYSTKRYHLSPKKLNKKLKTIRKKDVTNWDYKEQMNWHHEYPECGGKSQSPVDISTNGLVKTRGRQPLVFVNYNRQPQELYVFNDGSRLSVYGFWPRKYQPMVYGGAAHNRRYLFHSLTFHWPSEHRVGGLQYPLESQVLHVSADYKTLEEAIDASTKDRLAFLGIVNLFMYKNHTLCGIEEIIKNIGTGMMNATIHPYSLNHFNPPLLHYACYHGSLTIPPCTEAVLWLIRDKTLPITRKASEAFQTVFVEDFKGSLVRQTQALNDRKIYLF